MCKVTISSRHYKHSMLEGLSLFVDINSEMYSLSVNFKNDISLSDAFLCECGSLVT